MTNYLPHLWPFNADIDTNKITMAVNGVQTLFDVNTAQQTWSLTNPGSDDNTIRFEVRHGDYWHQGNGNDISTGSGVTKERSELSHDTNYNVGQTIYVSYDWYVEAGAQMLPEGYFCDIGQIHGLNPSTSALFMSWGGDKCRLRIGGAWADEAPATYGAQQADTGPVPREIWYHFDWIINMATSGGRLKVTRTPLSGAQAGIPRVLADYSGAMPNQGSTQMYWKHGIYRGADPAVAIPQRGTLAILYKNFYIGTTPPPAGQTVRTVGTGKTYSTIQAAYTAANSGDIIRVDAGTYSNISMTVAKNLTFECATGSTNGFVVIDSTGNTANDKGYFITQGNISFDHFEFKNAVGSSGNIAGVRFESGNLTCTNCWFHNCQNGMLASPLTDGTGTITLDKCEFNNNGTNTSSTHNIYIGRVAQLTVTNSYFHDCLGGNEFKSRAYRTDFSDSRVHGYLDNANWEIDFPSGGICNVTNVGIQQSPNSQNSSIANIGAEATSNPPLNPTNIATFNNCYIFNDKTNGTLFLNNGLSYSWNNTTIWKAGTLTEPATMVNNTYLTTRPTLLSNHPWQTTTVLSGVGASSGLATVTGASASSGSPVTRTVGTGKTYPTIQAAVAAANSGDTIAVDAGTYLNLSLTVNKSLTFVAVGGFVVIDSTGNTANDKGYFVTQGNISFDFFEFKNAVGASGNIAGIRYESGVLTCTNCWFHNCQNGILAGPIVQGTGTINLDKCEFNNNGTNTSSTHNMYIGYVAQLTVTNSYFHDVNGGNEFKSRAARTDLSNSRIFGLSDNGNWEVDFPSGGVCNVTSCIIQQSVNSQNNNIVDIGAEDITTNPVNSLNMQGNTIINDKTNGSLFFNPNSVGNVTWNNTSIWKAGTLTLPSGMTNTVTLSSRPTLDLSHPWASNIITVKHSGGMFDSIGNATAAAEDGDIIEVDAGVWIDAAITVTKNLTYRCATGSSGGFVQLDLTMWITNDKAYFVTQADVSFDHFEFTNAAVADANGAGIKCESGNLTLTNCWFHDNENGLLAGPGPVGTISIDKCEFNNNGADDGRTHNLYCGQGVSQLTVTNSYFHDVVGGNEFKSRADRTDITNCRIQGMNDTANWELDIPDGGICNVTNTIIQQSPNSQNTNMTDIGAESTINANSAINFQNCTFINDMSGAGALFFNPNNLPYTFNNSQIWKVDILVLPSGMINNTILGARPTLDTSHPWSPIHGVQGIASGTSTVNGVSTLKSGVGSAVGTNIVSGIGAQIIATTQSGGNLLYVADRLLPASGPTGAVTSTHSTNTGGIWFALLIGIEAAQVVNPTIIARPGTAAGTSSVVATSGVVPVIASRAGTATGTSSVSAVGGNAPFTFAAKGTAAGLASVSAISSTAPFTAASPGTAVGLSSVNAIGGNVPFTFSAVGHGSGLGSGNGVSVGNFTFAAAGIATGLVSVFANSIVTFVIASKGFVPCISSVLGVGKALGVPDIPPPDTGPGTSFDWVVHPKLDITKVVLDN